jgi:hypothetical protein
VSQNFYQRGQLELPQSDKEKAEQLIEGLRLDELESHILAVIRGE